MEVKRKLSEFLKRETVLTVAILLAIVSAVMIPPDREYAGYIDFRTLSILFCLMTVMAGLQKLGVFRNIAKTLLRHTQNTIQLAEVLVLLCFIFSMIITNDVALITFVPFTIEILGSIHKEKHLIPVIVLQTIAANLGSMLTPIGNPQNLYLYSVSSFSFGMFIRYMLPLVAVSFFLLQAILLFRGWKERGTRLDSASAVLEKEDIPMEKIKLLLLGILFLVCMGTVLRILPYGISFLAVVIVGMIAFRDLFAQVDYFLLGTFAGFFIFVGNVQRIPSVSRWIGSVMEGKEFWLSIGCSQIISNVPAAILLSRFTQDACGLLVGVNVGGAGTLVASLASLITFREYTHHVPNGGKQFLFLFSGISFAFLAILLTAMSVLGW